MEKDYVQILMDGITQIVDAKIAAASKNYTAVQEATIVENHDRNSGQYTVLLDGARRLASVAEGQSGVVFYLQDQVYVGNLGGSSDLVILGKKVTADTAPMIVADPFTAYVRFLKTDEKFKGTWIPNQTVKTDILTVALNSKISSGDKKFSIDITAITEADNTYKYQLTQEDFLGSLLFDEYIVRYATVDVSNLAGIKKIVLSVQGLEVAKDDNGYWTGSFLEFGNVLSDADGEEVFIWSPQEEYTYSTKDGAPAITEVDLRMQYTYLVPGTTEYKAATSVAESEGLVVNGGVYWERLDTDGVNWRVIDGNGFDNTIPLRGDVDTEQIRVRLEKIDLETSYIETLYSNILVFTNEKQTDKQYIDVKSFNIKHLTNTTNGRFPLWNMVGQMVDWREFLKTYEVQAEYSSLYSDAEIFDSIDFVSWTYPSAYVTMTERNDIQETSTSDGYTTVIFKPIEAEDPDVKKEWLKRVLHFQFTLIQQNLLQEISRDLICKINYRDDELIDIEAVAPLYFAHQSITGDSLIVQFYSLDSDDKKIYHTIFPTDSKSGDEKVKYFTEMTLLDSNRNEIDLSSSQIKYQFLYQDEKTSRIIDQGSGSFSIFKDLTTGENVIRSVILRVIIQKQDADNEDKKSISLVKDVPIPIYNSEKIDASDAIMLYTGPQVIEYDSSGLKVSYQDNPLELYKNFERIEGSWECGFAAPSLKEEEDKVPEWKTNALPTLVPQGDLKTHLIPKNYYESGLIDGYDFYVALKIGDDIAFVQPIVIRKSNYISSLINEWDGGYQVTKGGQVMTPALIAGSKDKNNAFTGVVAGDFKGVTKDGAPKDGEIEAGILGYQGGNQSFGFLSDGTAFLGQSGQGRIEFDGNKGTIQSGNFNGIYDAEKEKFILDPNRENAQDTDTLQGSYFDLSNGRLFTNDGQFKGHVEASSGTLGGFDINQDRMHHKKDSNTVDFFIRPAGETQNSFTVGTSVSDHPNDTEYGNKWRLWIKGNTANNYVGKFGVHEDGTLYATGAKISGTIFASAGRIGCQKNSNSTSADDKWIGGWTITENQISNGEEIGTEDSFYMRSSGYLDTSVSIAGSPKWDGWRLAIGGNFGVDSYGTIYAQDAHIVGAITANTGSIGGENGWTIDTNEISTGKAGASSSFYLRSSGDSNPIAIANSGEKKDWRLSISNNFGVDSDGTLYAAGADISGALKVSDGGSIGGWQVGTVPDTLVGSQQHGHFTNALYSTVEVISEDGEGSTINKGIILRPSTQQGAWAMVVGYLESGSKRMTEVFGVKHSGDVLIYNANLKGQIEGSGLRINGDTGNINLLSSESNIAIEDTTITNNALYGRIHSGSYLVLGVWNQPPVQFEGYADVHNKLFAGRTDCPAAGFALATEWAQPGTTLLKCNITAKVEVKYSTTTKKRFTRITINSITNNNGGNITGSCRLAENLKITYYTATWYVVACYQESFTYSINGTISKGTVIEKEKKHTDNVPSSVKATLKSSYTDMESIKDSYVNIGTITFNNVGYYDDSKFIPDYAIRASHSIVPAKIYSNSEGEMPMTLGRQDAPWEKIFVKKGGIVEV